MDESLSVHEEQCSDRQTDRQAGRQTDRQADKQTERQADRQRDRQTDRKEKEGRKESKKASTEGTDRDNPARRGREEEHSAGKPHLFTGNLTPAGIIAHNRHHWHLRKNKENKTILQRK